MTLIDRITPPGTEESKEIAIAELAAVIFLDSQNLATRAQIKAILNLDATDDKQLNEIATKISSLTANEQIIFSLRVLFGGILWERNRISLAQFKGLLGIV